MGNKPDPGGIDPLEPLDDPPLPPVPPVQLSPTSDTLTASAEMATFQVTVVGHGVADTWTVEKNPAAAWLTIESPTDPQTESGPVNYSVTLNTGTDRTTDLTVNGETFTVTQTGPGGKAEQQA